VNKGLGIGVAIGIAIAAIAGAYALFGIQEGGPLGGISDIGVGDTAKVEISIPSESEETSQGETDLAIKDVAEVKVENPEAEPPERRILIVNASENVGFADKP